MPLIIEITCLRFVSAIVESMCIGTISYYAAITKLQLIFPVLEIIILR
jgi:hypothetical protein